MPVFSEKNVMDSAADEKGKLLGRGMTSEVYEWGGDKVLKLYYKNFGEIWVNRETEIGYAVHEAGVPAPAIVDTIKINGRRGIIFQRIKGRSMLKCISTEPWNFWYYSRKLARFHYKIHKCQALSLPTQKERIEYTLSKTSGLSEQKKHRILEYFYRLPGGTSICHGDFHFDNVIMGTQGLYAVDWSNAYRGNPLGDVARTCLMFNSPALPAGFPLILAEPLRLAKKAVALAYLDEYMKLSNVGFESINTWILPVAAARLREAVPGELRWLMDIIDNCLSKI